PRGARLANPFALGDVGVAEPVPLEPDEDTLPLAGSAGCGERLEVERQVLLEIDVERRPAIADPTGEACARWRLAADDDRRRRRRDRVSVSVDERVVRGLACHGPTGPQCADHGDRFFEPGLALRGGREVDAVRGMLLRGAADPHAEHEPATARDL